MKKFEYDEESVNWSRILSLSNAKGQEGWELVAILGPSYEYGPHTLIFKREIESV